jgi:hypothetical protein
MSPIVTLFDHANPRLDALADKYGVRSELPYSARYDVKRILVETAAEYCPTLNAEHLLGHEALSFLHPMYGVALSELRGDLVGPGNVFQMTKGVASAVVLAGTGLPVAPFDAATGRIIGQPSNDIEAVLGLFAGHETWLVGYNVCAVPFYLLVANCVRTLRHRSLHDPEFSQIKMLFEREGDGQLPPDPGRKPKGCACLFKRAPGDTIASVGVSDIKGKFASPPTMLFAGWELDGQPYGAPNDGYLPVPTVLLRRLVNDPEFRRAFWIEPSGEGHMPTRAQIIEPHV